MSNYQTVRFGGLDMPVHRLIISSLKGSDWLAEQLAEKLQIEADSRGEAVDFVRQALLDIAEEQYAIVAPYRAKSSTEVIAELRKGGPHD